MATSKKSTPATFFLPGDKIVWRGMLLTVIAVEDSGAVEAASQTMRVYVSDPKELRRPDTSHL